MVPPHTSPSHTCGENLLFLQKEAAIPIKEQVLHWSGGGTIKKEKINPLIPAALSPNRGPYLKKGSGGREAFADKACPPADAHPWFCFMVAVPSEMRVAIWGALPCQRTARSVCRRSHRTGWKAKVCLNGALCVWTWLPWGFRGSVIGVARAGSAGRLLFGVLKCGNDLQGSEAVFVSPYPKDSQPTGYREDEEMGWTETWMIDTKWRHT